MKMSLVAAVAAVCALTGPAAALPIGFGFNAGEIVRIAPEAPSEMQAFLLGEDLFLEFTIDSATLDVDDGPDSTFEDPLGTIKVTGLTSGAMLEMSPDTGVEIQFDDPNEFELKSLLEDSTPSIPFVLTGDTDFNNDLNAVLNGPALSPDIEDLSASIASLQSFVIGGVFSTPNGSTLDASIDYFNETVDRSLTGILFGPVPWREAPTQAIPVPAALPLLATGLAGLVALRRRRRA
ncbi:MAG: VPLPA-CTERM sorting domain-containing protein [Pseudomonadota bacterium]